MAKKFFQTNNTTFTEYNVASDLDKRKEMIDKSGQMGVPVIDIDGNIIVGFDETRIRTALDLK